MPELSGTNASSHSLGSGNQVTRYLVVPWSGRLSTGESLLGSLHPEIPFSWCKSVRIDPFPDDAAFPYEYAKITAEYATDFSQQPWPFPKPSIRQNTILSVSSVQIGAEFLRVPARSAHWEDNPYGQTGGPIPEDDSPAGRIFVAKAEIVLTWDWVDSPPISAWNALRGKVNQATFMGCEAETLLFTGYELAPSVKASIVSPWTWKLTPKFSYRAVRIDGHVFGWNHEYRSDGWKRVVMYNGNFWADRYLKTEFSGMFL